MDNLSMTKERELEIVETCLRALEERRNAHKYIIPTLETALEWGLWEQRLNAEYSGLAHLSSILRRALAKSES